MPQTGRVYHSSLRAQVSSCISFFLRSAEHASELNCFFSSHVADAATHLEKFILVLTKKNYLSNIRHVSWGVQWNGRDPTMYRLHALQIRRSKDASAGHALTACSNRWFTFY